MTRRASAVIVIALAYAFAHASAGPPGSNEPFSSFRVIDKQLSLINERSPELKTATSQAGRSRAIHAIHSAIGRIRQRSQRLTSVYRARHERFGVKMFRVLDEKAVAVSRSLAAIQQARKPPDRDRALDRFNRATLNLVLQFQAVSANYGANHCAARQWACCEPKRDPETNRASADRCQWSCAATRQACGGFLGPETLRPPSRPR